jgi:TetR/AcrR family acrAB operon transcriptional repressor
MARKTKAEAEQTRHRIITCSRQVFCRAGVTNTSLEEIAKEAGVTRGAVYWHFKNKADLFLAVRAETGRILKLERTGPGDALQRLERGLRAALQRLEDDAEARASYEVMLWKCEYVGEFSAVRDDLMGAGVAFLADAKQIYQEAKVAKLLPPWLDPEVAALETLCFYTGILKLWLADPTGKVCRRQAAAAIAQHVRGRRVVGLRSASAKRN